MERSWSSFAALALFTLAAFITGGEVARADACADPSCLSASSGTHAAPDRTQETGAEQELADRYRPVVFLKEQDADCDHRGEPYFPVGVDIVLGNPDITLRDGADGDRIIMQAPEAADLYDAGEAWYLDFPGDPKQPRCDYERYFQALAPPPPPAVYAHITREDGRDELVLQYWFYFYFNDWNNNHESDWEFIQLVFEADSVEQALTLDPISVVFSQHGGGETSDWHSSKLKKEGERPIVFVAAGSHAIQFSDETYLGKAEAGTGFGCDDASGPSYRVDPAAQVFPEELSGSGDPLAWIAYEGRWGERTSGEFNGPTGPNMKTPWREPLTWQEKQRDSSLQVPHESIGPNAAQAFCGIVAFGSRLLFAVGPWVMLALILGLVGSLTVTAVRTEFVPASIAPLRQRRHFGQIVAAALVLQRRQPWLFFGIGALFVPVGIVTGVIQQFLIDYSPLGHAVEVVETATFSAIAALAVGVVQFGLAYWIVINASIAAVDRLQEGRPATVLGAYRDVWDRIGRLGRARGRAIGIIFLLTLSIVGIPVAIWLGVRWIFLEQAILIDDHDHASSRVASERAVDGAVWRTLGAAALIIAAAVLVGPILGVLMVLLSSASLTFINLLSSVLYVVLVPFAGIGLTLLYYDSVLRHEEDDASR